MSEWISVKYRLPPMNKTILACDRWNNRGATRTKFTKRFSFHFGINLPGSMKVPDSWYENCRFTHWMPLPTPPSDTITGPGKRVTPEEAFEHLMAQPSVKRLMKNLADK